MSKILKLKNFLYMEGLKENLISIIQICDKKCPVKFIHNKCTVYDNLGNIIVKGSRSKENCYYVSNPPKVVYNRLNLSTEDLWHQHLRHVNYKLLEKISSLKEVKGLPSITNLPK